jgi:hypothetical protein
MEVRKGILVRKGCHGVGFAAKRVIQLGSDRESTSKTFGPVIISYTPD